MAVNINKQGIISASGNVNPNVMPNSYIMQLGTSNVSTGTWRVAGSNTMTRSRVLIQNGMYGFQNSGTQTANDGSCYGIDSFPTDASTDYIISMYARITSGTEGYAGFYIYNATMSDGSHTKIDKNYRVTPLTTEWKRCWLHFITNTLTARNLYIGITTGETNVTTQMCLVKIEKGTVLTPWSAKDGDDMFMSNALGFVEPIENTLATINNTYVASNQFIEI